MNSSDNITGILPYDPGRTPTLPAPEPGAKIEFLVAGLPPYKETSRSIRNPKHPRYDSFVALRNAATKAMNGCAWYRGPIQLDMVIYAESLHENKRLVDYLAGVMDTLDGSSGPSFTYLPIAYQNDCQVCSSGNTFVQSDKNCYAIRVVFLDPDAPPELPSWFDG